MKNLKSVLIAAALGATALTASSASAAGFIALEGSDATSLHRDVSYTTQLFKYLKGSSTKSVLVLNTSGTINIDAPSGQTNVYKTSLAGLTLTDYSAIYLQPPGGCCSDTESAFDTYGASINSFIALGGNVAIGDYEGGAFDGVVPGGGAAAIGTLVSGCSDGETVTAAGIAKGFSQPAVLGCWSHQGYQSSYWETTLGYLSLMKADPNLGGTYKDGTRLGSSFLAIGGSLGTPAVPEPATWGMMLVGFGIVGGAMRARRRTSVSFG